MHAPANAISSFLMQEKLDKEKAEAEKNAPSSSTVSAPGSQPTSAPGSGRGSISVAPPREEPEINPEHLQQVKFTLQ